MPILKIKNDAGTFVEVPALKGSDGYTPVRGVDYYTEADKNELTAEIIDSISIPTKTSELTNDSLFISEGGDISDLSNDVGYLAGTDTTLTQEGKAADAKTVGTQLATKQNIISDLSTIRSGAAAGATAVQSETDPTVPSWAKQTNKPSYEANEITYGDSNIGAAMGEMEESIGNLNEDLSTKLNEPTSGLAVGKYFRVASIDADGHAVLEACDLPIAGSTSVGLVKISSSTNSGIFLSADGNCQIESANDSQISSRLNTSRPINPSHLDYAVKCALTDGIGADYTDAEQKAACDRLGAISSEYQSITEYVLNDELYDTQSKSLVINLEKQAKNRILIVIQKGTKSAGNNNYFHNFIGNTKVSYITPCYFDSTHGISYCLYEKINESLTKYVSCGTSNGYGVTTKLGAITCNISDITKLMTVSNGSTACIGNGAKFIVCID